MGRGCMNKNCKGSRSGSGLFSGIILLNVWQGKITQIYCYSKVSSPEPATYKATTQRTQM
jgi:hypothetical protein